MNQSMNESNDQITLDEVKQSFPDLNTVRSILIERIINKQVDSNILEQFDSNILWIKQCYNKPSKVELAMNALDELIGGHGVEAIRLEGVEVNQYWGDCIGSYVNTGDTYSSTVVYDSLNDCFLLTTWGDFYEHAENTKENYT